MAETDNFELTYDDLQDLQAGLRLLKLAIDEEYRHMLEWYGDHDAATEDMLRRIRIHASSVDSLYKKLNPLKLKIR